MKIAILGAMREEIEPILKEYSYKESKYANNNYYFIDYAGHELIVANSKIGKVNAAISASVMIEKYKADCLLFTGVAGSLNPELKIGDLLIANELVQHDVDITAFGHKPGFVPDTSVYIKTNEKLNNIAKKVAKELNLSIKEGIIATADQFICDENKKTWIRDTFNADAVEMEGASVALVCESLNVPCMILRAISDDASGNADVSFDEFLELAAKNSANFVLKMCEHLFKNELSKRLIKEVARACDKFDLIEEGDKVLVGLSGGKDSLSLLMLLKHMQRAVPFKFDFEAVTLSYGMGEDYKYLSNYCKILGIKHTIIDSNIYEISSEKIRKNSSFCSFFSRMRRGYLYTYAKENGFNKLALGHHLDDAIESFFMNFTYNGALRTLAAKFTSAQGVTVIRPLIFVRERMLRENAIKNGLKTIGDEACPAMRFDIKMPHARAETKELLASLEAQNPKLFKSLENAFFNIHYDTFFANEGANYCKE